MSSLLKTSAQATARYIYKLEKQLRQTSPFINTLKTPNPHHQRLQKKVEQLRSDLIQRQQLLHSAIAKPGY